MKFGTIVGITSVLCLGAMSLPGQDANQVEQLKKQLQQMQENFEKQQRQQQEQIEALKRQVETLKSAVDQDKTKWLMDRPLSPEVTAAPAAGKVEALEKRVDELTEASKKTFASQFNPAIGFVGDTVFSYRSNGSDKNGGERPGGADVFLRGAELTLEASVDPFVRGYAVVNASADTAGEATLGLEEAAVVTTSLPWNLTARAGRFFGEFGRLAYRHDHELPFVNRPLVLENFVGGESRTDGLEVNYLFPMSHYLSLTLGTGTQFGEGINNPGAYRSLGELNYWGRLSTYFDLGSSLSLEVGASGLLNDRTDDRGGVMVMPDGSTQTERRRRVAGLDFTLRYQPLANNRSRGLEWGTELLYSSSAFDFDPNGSLDPANPTGTPGFPAADGDEFRGSMRATGLYTYLAAKLNRQWTAGFAFDWLQSPLQRMDETFRYSPYLTWKPSEFQMFRLQYSYTDRRDFYTVQQDDHGIFLQWSFILGAHAHGFRQR
jgi:hypothetical protein